MKKKLLVGLVTMLFLAGMVGVASATPTGIGVYTDNLDGSYDLSNSYGSVTDTSVESFLGLASGVLDGLSTGNATEGSAMKDSLFVVAGQTFSFDWLWTSYESNPNVSYNDFSFVSLSLDGESVLADTYTADGTSGTFSWTTTSSGLLNYGIGVMDVNDTIINSYLTVSNISTSAPVPEPATMLLFGTGLAGLAGLRKRQGKK